MELVPIKSKKEKGFTLVEIIVTTFIFSLTIGTAMGIFASVIKLQRYNLKQHELLNQTGYAMEYISRAIRMAQKDDGSCGFSGINYNNPNPSTLGFHTYHNECWEFFQTADEILKINKNGVEEYPLISNKFKVTYLEFTVSGNVDGSQPKVRIFMTVQGAGAGEQPQITIQTAISQRNLNE